jgi:hypothetical protein
MTSPAYVYQLAHRVFGNSSRTWLATPNEHLAFACPRDLIESGGKGNLSKVVSLLQEHSTAKAVRRTSAILEAAQILDEQQGLF